MKLLCEKLYKHDTLIGVENRAVRAPKGCIREATIHEATTDNGLRVCNTVKVNMYVKSMKLSKDKSKKRHCW